MHLCIEENMECDIEIWYQTLTVKLAWSCHLIFDMAKIEYVKPK